MHIKIQRLRKRNKQHKEKVIYKNKAKKLIGMRKIGTNDKQTKVEHNYPSPENMATKSKGINQLSKIKPCNKDKEESKDNSNDLFRTSITTAMKAKEKMLKILENRDLIEKSKVESKQSRFYKTENNT